MYKAGIIGAGSISEEHIKACINNSNIAITAIAEIKPEKAFKLIQDYNLKAKVFTDYREMLDETNLNMVIINLPHFLHLDVATYCAQKGCHILLEKPMALNTAECDEILQIADRNNIKLMIGHVIHYYAETILAKELVKTGELGELLMINDFRSSAYFTSDRPDWYLDKKQSGGGILMNLGAHSIDRIMWITGRKIKSVQAHIQKLYPGYNVEGHAHINILLDGNIPAAITLYGYEEYYKNLTTLYFTEGVAEVIYGEGVRTYKNGKKEKLAGCFKDAFELQLNDFSGCIENRIANPIPGEYGREIINVIQKCYEQNGLTL